jgi:hypothetical protein
MITIFCDSESTIHLAFIRRFCAGKHAAERLKPCGETSDNVHGKLTVMILGGDNQIKSMGTEQVNAASFPEPSSRATSFKFSNFIRFVLHCNTPKHSSRSAVMSNASSDSEQL